MVYESSYESGRSPFKPDQTRGYWANPSDYIYATIGLAFRLDVFTVSWFSYMHMDVSTFVPYIICLGLYVVPIMVIQSFMGQFSSSGFISSFRISPIFKGMGYISMALNIAILTYYSIFASVPLLFALNSLRPTLPWSCEAAEHWAKNLTEGETSNTCNITVPEVEQITNDDGYNYTSYRYIGYHVPSVLYFSSLFGGDNLFGLYDNEFIISWQILGCNILTWLIIAGIFYKFFNTEMLGKLIRYAFWITSALLVICLTRFIFLSGTTKALKEYFLPNIKHMLYSFPNIPIYTLSAFGAGWGTIISLSSFNKFKTNIMRDSWIICVGQMFILWALAFMTYLVENHFEALLPSNENDNNLYTYVEHHWILYLSTASALASLELPNMWSLLFYSMLTIAALIIMVIHIYSILVSIFDNFEALRARKTLVTFSLIGFLALCSIYSSSSSGLASFSALSMDSLFTQTALNLLLLLVVLWIYGRERFQRDIEFMLGQRFTTWKVNMLRYVSPICLLLTLLFGVVAAFYEHMFTSVVVQIMALLFVLLPWLAIPIYMVVCMLQTTGSITMRFKRCCRPTDWYPYEMDDRQRYEEAMGNMDITHQLKEVSDEIVP